jgi:phosphonate transport system ATP-binding protein
VRLVFDSVAKRFADGTAGLAGVTFEVPKGQVCVVLGPSGAGKSTLLRCVNGLVAPSEGRVLIDGVAVDRASLPVLRPSVGMVHQSFNLVDRASVAANVIAGALPRISTLRALAGLYPKQFQQRACALIADVGLSELHLKRRVSELSGGQQQRVGIARAFMLDPAIVLADEPVASLDPQTSTDVLTLLVREARTRGATVLCSLHQIDLALQFADRIVALRQGKVAFDGAPVQLTTEIIDRLYAADESTGAVALSSRRGSR